MKKFDGFKYRSSCNVCVWAVLALIGLVVLSSSAFADQDGDYTYTVSGGNATITGYTGAGGPISIPATLGGFPVVAIGDYAFEDFDQIFNLTSVTIPNSVTSIGHGAFSDCYDLTSVTIGNSVTSIGNQAFYNCFNLTSVTIPDSVTSIGVAAFQSCTGLTNLTIGNSVTSIGGSAFYGCSGLTSVTIPNSVTSIGNGAFRG